MDEQDEKTNETHWQHWHKNYENANSSLARRLSVVRQRISEALDRCPPGPIHVVSMCAGDGRDLLSVLFHHPRAEDVGGRLVELDPLLAQQARATAPATIEIVCGDAGQSGAYEGAVPANLLLCCGVFGNISEADIRATIHSWPMLCATGATVIWTRGAFASRPDIRENVREWVRLRGFEEIAFDGPPESYGVGVAKMVCRSEPYRAEVHLFQFLAQGSTIPK